MQITFRDAVVDDLTVIVEIYNSVIPFRNVTADTEAVSVDSRLAWFYEHGAARPLWIVENENEETIGWVSFQNFYGRPAYNFTAEISIYLAPAHRQKGYGTTILSYCLSSVPSLGIKTLLGFIFSHNAPSIKLFEAAGFKCWGTLPDVALLDNVERTLKIFGRRISQLPDNL